jgi:tetratricopeptide (TPR) repeat protein
MRIVFTFTLSIFTVLIVHAQEPPEPPIVLAPIAPLPPLPPVGPLSLQIPVPLAPGFPVDFAEFPLLAFQDTQRDSDRAARRDQEQLRRLQDRSSESYSRGKNYLDRKEYDRAIDAFSQVIDSKASRADGAYYWRSYAQNKLGHRDEALAGLAELGKSFPSSRWLEDAKALQVEIRSQSGQPVSPESATDEDLKLLALNSLMATDPDRSIPMLEKLLKSSNSPKVKERALFVLAQSRSQGARDLLAGIAKGGSNPDLQSKAIEYLGISGGRDNLQTLVEIYKGSNDAQVKRTILNSLMVAGSRENLLAVAKSESNPELKVHAIRLLGNVGGSDDLAQIYSAESSPEVKRAVIEGLFVSGNADKLFQIVKNEKDDSLRRFAINQLGVMGRSKTGAALTSMYAQENNADNKKAIVNALFVQGNAAALIEIARKETDLNLKKTIVGQLSVMHSKEATDYLMEILTK